MKVNRLETHDRFEHFIKDQSNIIAEGAEACLKQNPDSLYIQEKLPYVYIFAFPKTLGLDEKYSLWLQDKFSKLEDIPEKVLWWQPRIAKPVAQTNSYCFRAVSKTDILEICWIIPAEELWGQYKKGNVTENEIVEWSISMYKTHKDELEKPHPEDFSGERLRQIFGKKFQMVK